MAIDFTLACRWWRRLGSAASAVLVAAGLLLPVGGSAVAQGDEGPTNPVGDRVPARVGPTDSQPVEISGQYPYPPRDDGRVSDPPPDTTSGSTSKALTLVNLERAKAGCASLQVVPRLQALAEQQSRDQAARDRSGSDGADGSTSSGRLHGLGYSRWGENTAWYQGDEAQSVQSAVDDWAGSENIRNCVFKETGLAVARSNSGKFYWTQTFGG